MTSRELQRAEHIHKCLNRVKEGHLKKYSDRLKGAPAEFMENGLLQTLAFYQSKKEEEYKGIASDLMSWLVQLKLVPKSDLNGLVSLDPFRYRRSSEEAIAWLHWAKRLAAAKVAVRG
jgi:CRISPR-associated protein Cmr5